MNLNASPITSNFMSLIYMRFSPLFVCFFLFAGVFSAQETLVTDHKGTKKIVASNTVTTTATAPTSPVEGGRLV